jgi:hypothetical protein
MNPVSLEGWWKCCGGNKDPCGREVNSKLFGETCPDCRHDKCSSCGTVERPSPVSEDYACQQYANDFNSVQYANDIHAIEYVDDFPQIEFTQRTSEDDIYQQHGHNCQPVDCPRRPLPMRGWWRCCQCNADNNPGLHERDCPNCDHMKCSSCYIHPQRGTPA